MSNEQMSEKTNSAGEGTVVLAVDTTTPRISIVIARESDLLASISGDSKVPHSRTFFDNLTLALRYAGLKIDHVDLFAAVTGPGSFTGLRVGLAAVNGLAVTTGKPAIGINKIDLVALSCGIAGEILVILEAGRSEVFTGLRRISVDGTLTQIDEDRVGLPRILIPSIIENRSPDLLVGSGCERYKYEIDGLLDGAGRESRHVIAFDRSFEGIQILDGTRDFSVTLSSLALRLYRAGLTPPLSAYYIRPSDAELKAISAENPA